MPSLRGSLLRLILNVRRAFIDWEAPVERFRSLMTRSERSFKPPRDVDIKPVMADDVPGLWLIPPHASPQSVILYLHGGGWTLGLTNIHIKMIAYLCRAATCR